MPELDTNMDPKAPNFAPAHAPGGTTPGSSDDTLQVFHSTTQPRSGVLLKTAIAKVKSRIYTADANILFDEGAQRSFVTRDLADKHQLQTSGTEEVQLAAFGPPSKKVSHIDTATIYLLTDSREKIAIDVLIVPTIAAPLGNRQRNVTSLPYLCGIKLAHPLTGEDFFSISILIGADRYWDIVGNRIIRGDGPTANIISHITHLQYWLPKLHKRPYKSRFIANSSACTTTELSIRLTSCLTAIKNHVIKYYTTVYERNVKNLFWSIKSSGEILNKLKSRGFLESGLSTYDFSTLYTTWLHNLIKEKLTALIEQTFIREGSLYLACYYKNAFFTSEQPKRYKSWSCQKMCDALHYLLDDIFIRFGSKLYRQIVGIPMGTNCAPLVADLI